MSSGPLLALRMDTMWSIQAAGPRARRQQTHEPRTEPRAVPPHRTTVAEEENAHRDCLDRIRQLREENEVLRKSADEFAALAERLQRELVRERRRNTGAAGHGDEAGCVRAI